MERKMTRQMKRGEGKGTEGRKVIARTKEVKSMI